MTLHFICQYAMKEKNPLESFDVHDKYGIDTLLRICSGMRFYFMLKKV